MGILDSIRNRISGDPDEYDEQDQYYDDQEDYGESYEEDRYYEDASGYGDAASEASAASNRKSSVFDNYTPLVSMSDVRAQELPSFTPNSSAVHTSGRQSSSQSSSQSPSQTGRHAALPQMDRQTPLLSNRQAKPQIRTSLPYVRNSAEKPLYEQGEAPSYHTGPMDSLKHRNTTIYAADEITDPLHKKHSLSNTGDFSATSPAYYASRSGVGHVRPAGQVRRTRKFREVIVVTPASYADAEAVASSLRRDSAVVLVLTQTRPELAKRILDFSFGAAAVAEAQVVTISERIYALTNSYALTDAEIELLESRGVI